MKTNHNKIKNDLLGFDHKNGACITEYRRLYKAESIEEVIAVVKDNFWRCAKYIDFADVIMANREQFAEYHIWVNQDVEIQEGVGYLLATEGEINATSRGTSTINATSLGTSAINATSRDSSAINAKSWHSSTINATSLGFSTINAESMGTSTISAKSRDSSTMIIRTSAIECKVYDHSIARYIYENRILVADNSIKLEKSE